MIDIKRLVYHADTNSPLTSYPVLPNISRTIQGESGSSSRPESPVVSAARVPSYGLFN
jgi:hypothetical protein